jgi:hypothetical protein
MRHCHIWGEGKYKKRDGCWQLLPAVEAQDTLTSITHVGWGGSVWGMDEGKYKKGMGF